MLFGRTDTLIARYLDGVMTPSEHAAFTRRLETDAGLRKTLELEKDIREAMTRDAHAIPAAHTGARARALAMAASTPPITSTGSGGKPGNDGLARDASSGKGPAGTGAGGAIAAGLILKIVVGVVATACIVAAVILFGNGQHAYQPATPEVERRAGQPPPLLFPPATKPGGIGVSDPMSPPDSSSARPARQDTGRDAVAIGKPAVAAKAASRPPRATREGIDDPAGRAAARRLAKRRPPEFRSDSLHTNVTIGRPKR